MSPSNRCYLGGIQVLGGGAIRSTGGFKSRLTFEPWGSLIRSGLWEHIKVFGALLLGWKSVSKTRSGVLRHKLFSPLRPHSLSLRLIATKLVQPRWEGPKEKKKSHQTWAEKFWFALLSSLFLSLVLFGSAGDRRCCVFPYVTDDTDIQARNQAPHKGCPVLTNITCFPTFPSSTCFLSSLMQNRRIPVDRCCALALQ